MAVGILVLALGAAQLDRALAGPAWVDLYAGGGCDGSGFSGASPGATAYTKSDPGEYLCADAYLTYSRVTNGVNYSNGDGWAGWDQYAVYFPAGTTLVASTHNIESDAGLTSGWYGTNTW